TSRSLPASFHRSREPSWMVAACSVVIRAREIGRSATSSEVWRSDARRCLWTFLKVKTEFCRSARIWPRSRSSTVRRTSSRVVDVTAAEITTIHRRNFVRSLQCIFPLAAFHSPSSGNELVPHPVHGSDVDGLSRVFLDLLSQLEHVVINCSRGRIILVTPRRIEQLFPRYHSLGVLGQELQYLELLRSQNNRLARTGQVHPREIHSYLSKAELLAGRHPRRPPNGGPYPRQQLPWAERFGDVIVGTHLQ